MSSGWADQVARHIMSYFVRNPAAADDLEGIARWRLLDEAVHRTVDETRLALDGLVQRGLLVQTVRHGVPIFSLDAGRRADAERFIVQIDPPQGGPSASGTGECR